MASNRDWGVAPSSLSLPPFASTSEPQIFIGPDVPTAVQTAVRAHGRTTRTAVAVVIYALDYDPTGGIPGSGNYWFDAVTVDQTDKQLAKVTGVVSDLRLFYTWVTEAVLGYDTSGPLGSGPPYFGAGERTLLLGGDGLSPMSSDTYDPTTPISMPRGVRAYAASSANTGAIGAGFTLVLQTQPMTFRSGRAYRVEIGGVAVNSLATNAAEFAVNVNYGSGDVALWYPGAFGPSGAPAGIATYAFTTVRNTGPDKTGDIRVYVRASGGGTVDWRGTNPLSGGPSPRSVVVVDVGAANDYVGAIVIP